jgi:hypothetical protein
MSALWLTDGFANCNTRPQHRREVLGLLYLPGVHRHATGDCHDSLAAMTEHLDAGWYDWVTSNLGRDPVRAAAATRAAAEAVAQGHGFNAATDAARASWEADRLAQVAVVKKADPSSIPGSLIAATALAVGGALASVGLILWMYPPTAACTDLCPGIRQIAYLFLWGNVAIAGLHASLFVLMWRRRAAAAWWASVTLVGAILIFDVIGELTVLGPLSNPNSAPDSIPGIAALAVLVPTAIWLLASGFHLGSAWQTVSLHWLLLHMILVELPILILFTTRAARRWCRIYLNFS